jgi:hypothetical protein
MPTPLISDACGDGGFLNAKGWVADLALGELTAPSAALHPVCSKCTAVV